MPPTELRFEDVRIGSTFGPMEFEVTPERARAHHESIDATHPRFTEGDAVEPSILGRFSFDLIGETYDFGGNIHAKQVFEFRAPVSIGDTVIADAAFTDAYERRGRKYVEMDVELRDGNGDRLGRSVVTHVVESGGG